MKHGTLIYWIAKFTYGNSFAKKNKVKLENPSGYDLSKGPLLLLSNHCGAYDPIMIGSVFPSYIKFVSGAYLFKNPGTRFVFKNILKSIPMQQGQSDLVAIRKIQKALKNEDVIGLFPEGTRTWDGDMVDFETKPLAKMIRIFKAPVAFINLEGVYASQPRWASVYRTGKNPVVRIKLVLTSEEIAEMSVEDIQNAIKDNLFFSNDEWKRTVDYNFVSPCRAEGVQRLLYMCPECKKIGTISSCKNTIKCSCGLETVLDDNDDIALEKYGIRNLADWHRWEAANIKEVKSLDKEKGVLLQVSTVGESKYKKLSENIDVSVKDRTLFVEYFKGKKQETIAIPFENIKSFILNTKQTMEIGVEKTIYRIRLTPDSCSLKFQELYKSK